MFLPSATSTRSVFPVRALVGSLLLASTGWAGAASLVEDYASALSFDPTYQATLAARRNDVVSVKKARSAFYPEATFSTQVLSVAGAAKSSLVVTQPIYSRDRQLVLRQADPLDQQSLGKLLGSQQDLARRLLEAANAIVLGNENLRLSGAKMKALAQQAERAREMRRLGQGTVTDERDIEVRFAQAQGERLRFITERANAAMRYAAITGNEPNVPSFSLPEQHRAVPLQTVEQYLAAAAATNASLVQAQAGVELQRLAVKRAQAVLYPSLVATAQYAKGSGGNAGVGLVFSVPLQAGTVYGIQGAVAAAEQAELSLRATEVELRLQLQSVVASIASANQSLDIQRQAIAAAELSVDANQQSYQGGVRSSVDVLNAIQTLYTVQSEYVNLATSQAQNHLSLLLLLGQDGVDAIAQIQANLFTP